MGQVFVHLIRFALPGLGLALTGEVITTLKVHVLDVGSMLHKEDIK
jgi:hypothetical protein